MILRRVAIDGFGKLAGCGPLEFSPSLTVIAGPNESGKSTLAECIIRLLFGFPRVQFNSELERYRPWRSGVPYRARLDYELDDGRAFETTRDFADDVRTVTRALDTKVQVDELSGGRRASPGQVALNLSLEAYRAAAFIGPGELQSSEDADFDALGERLASVVGSAGDEGADAAMLALYNFATKDIGGEASRTTRFAIVRTEREQADLKLSVATERLRELKITIEERAAAEAEVDTLDARCRNADIVVNVTRLRALQERSRLVEAARAAVAEAEIARNAIPTVRFTSGGRIQSTADRARAIAEIERAISDREIAIAEAASAFGRADGREPQRTALRADSDECRRAIASGEQRALELSALLDAATARAGESEVLDRIAVEQLEEQDAAVDAVESRARNLETRAAIARQMRQATPMAFAPVLLTAAIVLVIGLFEQATMLTRVGIGGLIAGLVMSVYYLSAAGKRAERIRVAEADAQDADNVLARAKADLAAACRAVGCTDVASVRARFSGQRDRGEIATEAAAIAQTLESRRAQLQSLEAQLESIGALERDFLAGTTASDQVAAALARLFDAADIPAGADLDERIAAFRELRSAGERAAHADAAVARARTSVAEALGSFDVGSLRAEIDRLDAGLREVSSSGPLPDAADDEAAALADRNGQRHKLIDAQTRLAELKAVLKDARLPDIAALEERAEASLAEEHRLAAAAQAALLARDVIDEVKNAVHKSYLPTMNAALGEALDAITSGKYAEANLDPADFAVRLQSPERGTLDPEQLSSGTIEQVNLALRAATAQALGSGERVPLILDDALAHADPDRAAAALSLLARPSRRATQSLFFTQRTDLVRFARGLPGVIVIDLDDDAETGSVRSAGSEAASLQEH